MHTLVMDLEPGYIGTEPGFLYRFNRDLYETITSSHLVLHTKPGRIKNFKLSGVTRQVTTEGNQLIPYPYVTADGTFSGITAKATNGHIKISGTTTAGCNYLIYKNIPAGTYGVKIQGNHTGMDLLIYDYNASQALASIGSSTQNGSVTFTSAEGSNTWLYFNQGTAGKTVDIDVDIIMTTADKIDTVPWEPYTGATSSPSPEYPQDVQGVGKRTKNLLNDKRMLDFILQKPGASIVQFDGRRCLKLDGGFNFPDFNLYEGFETEKRYTLTYDGFYEKYKTEAYLGNGFAFTLQNGGRNLSLMGVSDIGTWRHKTTTSDTGVTKLTFTYGTQSVIYIDLDTIQLEEGTISTPYEPYGYRTDVVCRTEDDTESYTAPIYTREPLTQWDRIEYRNGEYGVARRGTTYTFTGQERFNKYGSNGFALTKPDMLPGNYRNDGYCNRFPCAKGTSSTKGIWFGADNNQYIYFLDVLGVATSVSEFAAWLQANPTTIVYQLAEEVWEPLPTISQQALRNLPTYKGATMIGTTDPLEPEITVSYRPQTDYSKLPGLEADYEKGIFTRLGAAKNLTAGSQFNRFPMYAGRRRCNVSDDGTITAYVGDPNYREDGSNGQVMVYQPKFYYQVVPLKLEPQTDGIGYHLRRAQYWVSHKPMPGFKLHPAFKKPAQKLEYIMYAAFEGSIYDTSAATYILDDAQVMDVAADKLSSIAGAKPTSGKTQQFTRPNVEQLAQNRGPGWHGDTIKAESANQLLMAIELGTMNTQAAIGQGVVSIPDTPNTENNSIIAGGTSNLGSNTGMADGDNGKVSVSYRGMENHWGNIWKQVYGVNIWGDGTKKGGIPYICTDYDFAESKNTGNYESAGFTLANANGYISAMGYSAKCDWLFMASECLGNNSAPVGDYTYITVNLNGYRNYLFGGSWDSGSYAGAFCLSLIAGVGYCSRTISGRLIYVP